LVEMFKGSRRSKKVQNDQDVQRFNAQKIMWFTKTQTFTQSYAAKWAEMRLVSIHLLHRHSTASDDRRPAVQWMFKKWDHKFYHKGARIHFFPSLL
jgi:hypothetical protein